MEIEVVYEQKMTATEVSAVVSILFRWWKREFEQSLDERPKRKVGDQ